MIVVVGLAFEARIAAGPGVKVICSGDGRNLATALQRAIATGYSGLISFGVAGGLAPQLRPGTCVVGSAVIAGDVRLPTDSTWSQRLLETMPGAVHGALIGVSQPIKTAQAKRAVHLETGAIAVDTESHVVARAAADHKLPMAVIRVIIDSAGHTLPEAAVGAVRPDGTTDFLALLRGVVRRPHEIAPLLRIAVHAQVARATLRRGRRLLGPNLGVLRPNRFNDAMQEAAVATLDAAPPVLGSSFG
jgi:adenosylhomocysteine nucleosidase